MRYLTPQQIEKIEDTVNKAEVKSTSLSIDLVDHICCLIEERLNQGMSMKVAENDVFRLMGILQLKAIGLETKYLTQNTFIMTTRTKIIGIVAITLMTAGFLMKSLHLQGAAVIWGLGILTSAFGFIILLFIDRFSYEETKFARINMFLGYLGASGIVLGYGFKLLHWPLATDMVFIGAFVLLIHFIFSNVSIGKNVSG